MYCNMEAIANVLDKYVDEAQMPDSYSNYMSTYGTGTIYFKPIELSIPYAVRETNYLTLDGYSNGVCLFRIVFTRAVHDYQLTSSKHLNYFHEKWEMAFYNNSNLIKNLQHILDYFYKDNLAEPRFNFV